MGCGFTFNMKTKDLLNQPHQSRRRLIKDSLLNPRPPPPLHILLHLLIQVRLNEGSQLGVVYSIGLLGCRFAPKTLFVEDNLLFFNKRGCLRCWMGLGVRLRGSSWLHNTCRTGEPKPATENEAPVQTKQASTPKPNVH